MMVKALIWAIALGSGTSGGVLAPLLMMGGMLGAVEATFLPGNDRHSVALVGMAAVMGGTMRVSAHRRHLRPGDDLRQSACCCRY